MKSSKPRQFIAISISLLLIAITGVINDTPAKVEAKHAYITMPTNAQVVNIVNSSASHIQLAKLTATKTNSINTVTKPATAPIASSSINVTQKTSSITTAKPAPIKTSSPVNLTTNGVDQDLAALGFNSASLKNQKIAVIASKGAASRRCKTGTSGKQQVQGMAIRHNVTYKACPNGQSPIYDEYYAKDANCTVIYNQNSPKKQAILAHELAHCLHFEKGQYKAFDIEYRKVRPQVNKLNNSQMAEIIADDIAQCSYGLSTNWNVSYYKSYGVSAPTTDQCTSIDELKSKYL